MSAVRSRPVRSTETPWYKRPVAIAAIAAFVVIAFLLWPSSLSGVRNLDTSGTSIIAFGDSLTAGYGGGPGGDYPTKLSATTGIPIINAGVSGDTTESALARIEEDVLSQDPGIVIVGLGGNDYLRRVPIATTEENLRTIIRRIQERGAAVVLLGFKFPSINANYGAMYERIADDEGCLFVPDLLDGILSNPSLKSDEIHPNAAGYSVMAERIEGPFGKLVARVSS